MLCSRLGILKGANMRRSRAVLFLITFALAAAAILSIPQRAAACFCAPAGSTHNYAGSGSSCTAANNNVFNQCDAEATTDCDNTGSSLCFESSVIVTVSCSQSGGVWHETGHIRY